MQNVAGEAIREGQGFLEWILAHWPIGIWVVASIAVVRWAVVPLVRAYKSGK